MYCYIAAMRISGYSIIGALILCCLGTPAAAERSFHGHLGAGYYAALGGPADWGPSLSVEVLPGHQAGRFGLRAQWRGFEGMSEGMALLSGVFEAGASRPQLVLSAIGGLGITTDRQPVLGGGLETKLRIIGPIAVSLLTDLQLIIDGSDTQIALSVGASLVLFN